MKFPKEIFQCLLVMAYLNSSLNPIIYSLQNRRFRETYTRMLCMRTPRQVTARVAVVVNEQLKKHSKTSFEKNCFSAWASTLNMGLINKVDMVCLSPVGYGV